MGGIQSADNRNVPTEGAFPELGIIEALTGEPATQDEINRTAESAPVKAGEPDPQSTLNQYQLDASEPAGPSTGFERTGNTESGARSDYQAGQRVGENASSQTNIGRSAAASARADVTQGTELTGDGRSFADFFAKVTGNKDARFIPVNPYRPAIPLGPSATAFKAARDKYRGNFDAHIATSIPGFDEVQAVVGSALLKTFGQTGAELLDIGTSEGGLIKALADSSGGKIQSVGIDPNKAMMATFDSKPQAQGAEFSFSAFGSAEDAGKVAWREGDGTEVYTFDPAPPTYSYARKVVVSTQRSPSVENEGGVVEYAVAEPPPMPSTVPSGRTALNFPSAPRKSFFPAAGGVGTEVGVPNSSAAIAISVSKRAAVTYG